LHDDRPTRDRLADWAYAKVRDQILDGEIPPGDSLSVPIIAERLDISRQPAREAILRLTSEGLAEEVPYRGAFVANVPVDSLRDLYAVRGILEGMAARLAAENVDADAEHGLEEALEAHRASLASGDRSAIIEADMAFHRLLYRMSLNPWLTDFLMRLQGLVRLGMRTTVLVPGSAAAAVHEHEEIMASVVARDSVNAELHARAHIDRLRSTLQAKQT
jgi:DNA-binding GntR family transcriptional regulator